MESNHFLRRIVQGFAFGLGFAAAAAIAWFVMREATSLAGEVGGTMAAKASARTAAMPVAVPGSASDVRVISHRVERRNGDTLVLGTLRNDADAAVGSVRVEAAYYDAGGRLVDVCGWYVAQRLAPGEEKPFKVSCGGTPEKPAPESASVKLRLVEAF
ncbi:MAG: FxLYD domain-containing protein [Vicinamibacteria bacterium]|jgi:hypothetical protein